MKKFFEKVDRRSRKEMVGFLTGHYRYDTMNSWNMSTSYANCVKVSHLGLTSDQLDRAYDILDMPDWRDDVGFLCGEWAQSHKYQWQVGFNGRSGGYLVLYQGGLDYTNAKTAACGRCGKTTWHKEPTSCTASGCSGTLQPLREPKPVVVTYSGKSLDMNEDFVGWDMADLRRRVELIQNFDRLCDAVVAAFVSYADDYHVEEGTVLVPTTVRVLKRNDETLLED